MSEYEFLTKYLTENFEGLEHDSSGGLNLDFPNFELMPFDYLEFAEQELTVDTTASRINCVSNIKRATECEMDTFIHILGLSKVIKSFPRKLQFFAQTGLISSRSLEKLNRIRNKMEHEYADPDLAEIDAYFDLANGFIHSIEGYIFMLSAHANQHWVSSAKENGPVVFTVALSREPAQLIFDILGERKITFDATDFETYLNGLKVFFLLCRATALLSANYVVFKLGGNKSIDSQGRYLR